MYYKQNELCYTNTDGVVLHTELYVTCIWYRRNCTIIRTYSSDGIVLLIVILVCILSRLDYRSTVLLLLIIHSVIGLLNCFTGCAWEVWWLINWCTDDRQTEWLAHSLLNGSIRMCDWSYICVWRTDEHTSSGVLVHLFNIRIYIRFGLFGFNVIYWLKEMPPPGHFLGVPASVYHRQARGRRGRDYPPPPSPTPAHTYIALDCCWGETTLSSPSPVDSHRNNVLI